MIFLEKIKKEYEFGDGDNKRFFTFLLSPVEGEYIRGNYLKDVPTMYPYGLKVTEHGDPECLGLLQTMLDATGEKNRVIVAGKIFLSVDEIKEFKKDPYAFCINNNIVDKNEFEKEDDVVGE